MAISPDEEKICRRTVYLSEDVWRANEFPEISKLSGCGEQGFIEMSTESVLNQLEILESVNPAERTTPSLKIHRFVNPFPTQKLQNHEYLLCHKEDFD
jgi:hypothetical protein